MTSHALPLPMMTATVVAALVMLLPPAPSLAQDRDEFYAIARGENGRRAAAPEASGRGLGFFSLFGGARRRDVPEITVRPGDDIRGSPRGNGEQSRSTSGENVGGPRAYCVRTCDGFFFPMGPATTGGAQQAQQQSCASMCPGAEVALYSVSRQGSIEDAVNARGQTYAALRTAFRFRQGLERTCSCQGAAANGLARLPITHDVTLRAGDVVVTETGVQVFRGATRFPYQPQDFVAARSYGRLPADVRRRVEEIQAGIQAGDSGAAAPVGRLPRATRAAAAGQTRDVAAPVAVSIPVNAESPVVRVIDITQNRETLMR
ncbi:MAG: DUF2865 domain-containing protein [Phreatobacter sp.]|uniref:DUF2865 domain-containing protein n=1 Tax=Phreatobacter sp. TaxID=1966341 RepID=UPI00273655F2|nr:DUF2865 domain-containing protein [Phreatobacter sp.]MDP2801217.1 DUF2865 domain-containing protein [Phreatobacter sp.]